MLVREYIIRVLEPREQFEEADLPAPHDRMPSYYYNLIRNPRKTYFNSRRRYFSKSKGIVPRGIIIIKMRSRPSKMERELMNKKVM